MSSSEDIKTELLWWGKLSIDTKIRLLHLALQPGFLSFLSNSGRFL
ncbi:MAG TPA: hypothetical protein PKA63_09680 [Oligoflexia bacterium]|nr:hypothetical protein [Oligoflexia bacterium]HMO19259.1 hypothetical protein [Oligoflexia bacterium]HMP48924.1 hypothetical protein [Oligoflexia bacterium]